MKKIILFTLTFLLVLGIVDLIKAEPFNFYESPYFGVKEEVYEYYTPKRITPLIAQLPEYSMRGPGYICDKRQASPVYRYPLQYNRHIGYREADWAKNTLYDNGIFPVNFGGYTY